MSVLLHSCSCNRSSHIPNPSLKPSSIPQNKVPLHIQRLLPIILMQKHLLSRIHPAYFQRPDLLNATYLIPCSYLHNVHGFGSVAFSEGGDDVFVEHHDFDGVFERCYGGLVVDVASFFKVLFKVVS